jgi:urease accessory protein
MNLPLLQLGDSALPIGGYSHSWGLEAAIDRGIVRDPPGLERWTRSWLQHAAGPCEGVIAASVCRLAAANGWPLVLHANELLTASLTPPTLRQASRDMGTQLLSLSSAWPWASASAASLHRLGVREWHHAVVFGVLASAAAALPLDAAAVYLHQAALGVIGAGVKAIPIGHTHGQQVLARLHDDIRSLALSVSNRDLETAGSFSPAHEVLCDAQTRLYTRLFRS